MRRIVTSKIIKTFLNTALMIVVGGMLSLAFAFGSKADQTLHTSDDNFMPSNRDLVISENTTIVIDGPKTIGQICFSGDSTLTIQGNDTDELRVSNIECQYFSGNLIVESGRLIASCDTYLDAIAFPTGTVTIKGGYVSATSTSESNCGIYAENINISGGEVVAKGTGSGLGAETVTISGGKVYGEVYGDSNLVHRDGIYAASLKISGGEVTAKSSYDGNNNNRRERTMSICTFYEPILTNGMTITEPENGAFEIVNVGGLDIYTVREGDNKMATVVIKKVSSETNTPSQKTSASKNNSTDNKHTHSYSWVVTKYPTSTSDGEEAYQCSCGEIERTSILPAISAFEEETINKIKNAPANAVIEVETSLFNSFGIGVRDALAARPGNFKGKIPFGRLQRTALKGNDPNRDRQICTLG